jgi:hypothetical protein
MALGRIWADVELEVYCCTAGSSRATVYVEVTPKLVHSRTSDYVTVRRNFTRTFLARARSCEEGLTSLAAKKEKAEVCCCLDISH